jgi:glycosyltransferase involved in cell wall biosynthesis
MNHIKETLAIVVLYNCELKHSATINTINSALSYTNSTLDLMVYDNSPASLEKRVDFQYDHLNIHYVTDTLNSGISKAYNTGAKYAKQLQQKRWLLLLDQDTSFTINLFESYFLSIQENPSIKLFAPILKLGNGAIFSPCINKHKRGYPVKSISSGVYSLDKLSPVNSGMLVDLGLFSMVGGYNEKIKVDFCDFQFLEKIQEKELDFYVIDSVALQDFSNDEVSLKKQQRRFEIYLEDARNCHKKNFKDKMEYLYTVTRHTFGLIYKQKSLSFLKTYILKYLAS